MGTEINSQSTRKLFSPKEAEKPAENSQGSVKHQGIPRKCICGCNTPMLYAKRECNIPYSNPRSNFKAILNAFFKENHPPQLTAEDRAIDNYDLFHVIQLVKADFGRISWRKVCKALRLVQSLKESRRDLKKYYKAHLKPFENWLVEKGPVSIGCIDTQLVIIILKEFLPEYLIKKLENESTENSSPLNNEPAGNEIAEVVEQMIVEIESGNVLVKKRKISEETIQILPQKTCEEEPKPQVKPIFIISPLKREKKIENLEKIGETGRCNDKSKNQEKTKKLKMLKSEGLIETTEQKIQKKRKRSKKNENQPEKVEKNDGSTNTESMGRNEGNLNYLLDNATSVNIIESKAESKEERPEAKKKAMKEPKKNHSLAAEVEDEVALKNSLVLDVVNPMTNEFRNRDPSKMNYRTDFRKGYLPIEMQEEHEILEKLHVEKESKAHFIRKKQSAVNIKRSCGVTYVKPTESKQKGVRHEFSPLPPLAFQVGTVDRTVPIDERTEYFRLADEIIKDIFQGKKILRVTVQENYSEEDLKNYILDLKPDGDEIFIDDVNKLWRVLGKDNFVVIHFHSDDKTLIVPAEKGRKSDVKIGFLVKKGLCGTKSVKKCLGLQEAEGDTLNMYATQIRLELYITKKLWKKALKSTQKLLCAFIYQFESYMQKMLVQWNETRKAIFLEKKIPQCESIYKWMKTCECIDLSEINPPIKFWEYSSNNRLFYTKNCLVCSKPLLEISEFYQKGLDAVMESKNEPNWYYLINTRDSFSYDLHIKKSYITSGPRKITRKDFFFHKDDLPSNYKDWEKYLEGDYVRTGVVTFHNCFSNEQLNDMEQDALKTESDFLKGHFLKNTAQPTFGAGGKIKRTKFFFGTRYMWTSNQLAEKQSKIAAGVRVDVSSTPQWLRSKIEGPLVSAGIVEKDFINSIAMNIYHDGKEGLAQHFDDAVRFKQPIFTVKLDSDSRLSFGSQFYGYLNGAFCIPCPRGAVCMLEEFSYAANSAKHCVRPCDLAGRSITVILRQIHPFIMEEANRYDREIDLPTWFSCLSLHDNAVSYAVQKEMQAKVIMKNENTPKSSY